MLVLTAPGRPAFENPVFEAGQPAPLMFIANQGQFDPAVKFELTGSMGSAVFTDNSIRIAVQKPGSIPPWAAEESPGGASPTPTPPAYSEEDPPRPEYSVVEIQFGGVNAAPQVGGEDSLATRISYFLGNDPAAWRMDVPAFSKIRYADFATGYDLEIDGSSGAWEWRLVESGDAAGAGGGGDPEGYASMQAEDGEELPDLTLTVEGGEVGVEGDNIVIETEAGEVTLPLIEVPQGSQPEDPSVEGDTVESPYSEGEGAEASAARKPVEKRAAGKGARDFFSWISASSYDSLMNPEALQPVENGSGEKGELLFSSYMGGAGDDVVSDAAYGPDGSMYVTGTAAQTWYISGATNVVSGSLGDYNVFVAKIDPQYHCEFIIFLGGEFSEAGSGIAVDESGSIYVVGHTYSPDFPMTSAHTPYKSALSCEYYCYADILLFKLAPAGNSLLYASYLGGSIFDYGYDIAYVPGSGGVVYIAGYTDSKHFYPFYQTGVGLSPDGVLAGFNTTLDGNASLITVQFIGGNGTHEQAHSVAVSPLDGSLWIVGQTAPLGGSGRFTALNGFDSEPGGGYDAFVVHFSTPSFSKMSSSYFGGSGDDCERGGSARECAIGVDAAGNAYITGNTRSPDLAQAYGEGLQAYGGGEDVFAAKIFTETCAGGGECMRLGYWRYLGGSGADSAFSIAVSAEGDAYISGETGSVNFGVDSFPKDLSMDPVLDFIDAFLIRLAPAGYVSYSTYYGGPDADFSKGVAVTEDGQKAAVVGGISDRKRDFPLVNPVDGDGGSGFEGIVGELSIPDWTPRIAIISPTDWAMVLSVVPTFTWKPAYEADRYILEIHRVNAQGEALEAAFKSKILLAADVCNNDGTCSFKLNNPEEVRDITKDILPSGSTLETGGYAWKITAEAANGKIIAESEYGYFQIPSLGGTWKDVKDAGLCDSLSCFMNGKPIVENPTWNEYDDWIYINAERWDIPPSLIKAIMAGETVHGIAPWIFGDESFPPNESYLYEPGEDCKFFVIDNDEFILEDTYKIKDFAIGIFENWDMGANPPWETTCQNGKPCTAPYNLDGNNLMMSIYDFAIGRGYGIGYKDPFDKYTDDIPGCNTRDHIAQYRISAGYGLGGITYIHEYRDILEHASKFYGSSVPQYIPPEFLYDPGFNIYMMGKILNDKRCACNDPVSAYTYEALEEWKNMVSAYNGWGNCPYGVKNLGRVKFTLPRSLKPEVNTVLREKTQHTDSAYKLNDETCDRYKACNSTRKSATSASTTMGGMSFARADNSDPQIVSSQMVDLKEDLGSVRVDLLIEKQDAYYIGWIRIYRDEDGTELIWQSDPIGNITLPAWIDTLEYEGGVIILTNWGDGAHATRVIPVIWDGISFRQVIARDENEQDVYIGGDGGAIIPYSQGYLAAYWRNMGSTADSSEVYIWAFDGSEFRIIRRYSTPPFESDHVMPESTLGIYGTPGENGWIRSDAEIEISATDDQAISSIYYKITNGASTWEMIIPMDQLVIPLSEGRWMIQYQAMDAAGNREELHSTEVLVDGTSPIIKHKIGGTDESQDWYPGGTIIEFEATDLPLSDGSGGSGVGSIQYMIGQEGEWQTYQEPFAVEGSGMYTIRYRATDIAGNISDESEMVIRIDQDPPATFFDITGCPEQAGYYACPVQIHLFAEDSELPDGSPGSGVDRIEYRQNGSGEWILYTDDILLNTSGYHAVQFRSIDKAGNMNESDPLEIWVDLESPISSAVITGEQVSEGQYSPGALVEISAQDPLLSDGEAGSGVKYIEFSLDAENNWQEYTGPIMLDQYGPHAVFFRAADSAGNVEETQQIEVEIVADVEPPTMEVSADPLELWPPNNKLVPVRIFGTAFDTGSGIQSIHIEVVDEYGECQPVIQDILPDEIVDGNWERTVELMASRKGNDKDGRKYTIVVTATDNLGNAITKEIEVIVPHDQGG